MRPRRTPSELYFFRMSFLPRHLLHAETTGRTGENMTGVYLKFFVKSPRAWLVWLLSLSLVPCHTLPFPHLEAGSHGLFTYSELGPAAGPLHWLSPPPGMVFPQPLGLQVSAPVSLRQCPWPLQEGSSIILLVTS